MIGSLMGSGIDVDLCTAKNKQLFFSVNAAGEPPFQGTVMGVPTEISALILVVIDQNFPFEVSIGILDTFAWQTSGKAQFISITKLTFNN